MTIHQQQNLTPVMFHQQQNFTRFGISSETKIDPYCDISSTTKFDHVMTFYYIPSSEILEFPSVINFDIITSADINFHFHFLP